MKKGLLVIQVVFVVVMMGLIPAAVANDNIASEVIIDGGWGKSISQFGRDNSGKTEDQFELNLLVSNDKIYILDSMNDRVQVFSNNGAYIKEILFNTNWSKSGLYMYFSIFKGNIYVLSGKPPHYSDKGIVDIQKYSIDGKFTKKFGDNYISAKNEDYDNLFSDANSRHLYVSVNGKKILAINDQEKLIGPVISANKEEVLNFVGISPSGNPIVIVTRSSGEIAHTMIIDKDSNKVIKTVSGRYSMVDDKGKFYSVRTISASKRKKKPMLTMVEVFDSVSNRKETFEFTGDIHVNKNGKEKVYKLAGNYFELSRMGADGVIYHMLALNDGVVVRKISIK